MRLKLFRETVAGLSGGGDNKKAPFSGHCERSEAISFRFQRLLRRSFLAPRNDITAGLRDSGPAKPLQPLFLCVFTVALAIPAWGGDQVVLLDGEVLREQVVSIDAGRLTFASGREAPALERVWRIHRPVKPAAEAAVAGRVYLADGSQVAARGIAVRNQVCTIRCAFGDWSLPVDKVRAFRLVAPRPGEPGFSAAQAFRKALAATAAADQLFAMHKEGVRVVTGVLQEISEKQLVFLYQNQPRKIAREKVFGVVLAPAPRPPLPPGAKPSRVWLQDGSLLQGKVTGLRAGKLLLAPYPGTTLALPWDAVVRLSLASDKLVFLSDLDPVKVVQRAIVTFAGPWRRDRSVLGRPLRLGSRSFEKGLGVHAECRLSYALKGEYETFAATIGIDAETEGRGDCVFRVLADGRELFRKRVRGTAAPQAVSLNVKNVQLLTLVVEPGEDLDLADHGDWCEARLVRP